MSLTIYAKHILAMRFAIDEYGHCMWDVKSLIIVLADNKK